jgi:hypothetical protein
LKFSKFCKAVSNEPPLISIKNSALVLSHLVDFMNSLINSSLLFYGATGYIGGAGTGGFYIFSGATSFKLSSISHKQISKRAFASA